ncbi:MAG TPA: hypothetical protein ENN21_01665 [Spirochaetes bacterium]|nr:hypothetical protein [Spirochaetota bacterium]
MVKTMISFLALLLAVQAPLYARVESTYQVTSLVSVPIKVIKYVTCEVKVKERKDGRWVYVKKKQKCPEEVEGWRTVRVSDVFNAKDAKTAIKESAEYYKEKGYKYIKLVLIKRMK